MEELWKEIQGYNGRYFVSNQGRVKRIYEKSKKENYMIASKNEKGYCRVRLSYNYKSNLKSLHRLVAEAFIPNIENKPEIDHINGNREDNRAENLRWVTHSENMNNPLTKKKMKEYSPTEETRKKCSKALKGRVFSEEHKRKIGTANKGKVASEETRRKISKGNKGKFVSEETRKKLSENCKSKHGFKSGTEKKVICIETQKIYESLTEAEKDCPVTASCISHCCRGKIKTAGGYHWEFIE